MPRRSGRGYGDLFITFEIDFPDKLTSKQKDAIKAAFQSDNAASELQVEHQLQVSASSKCGVLVL